MGKDNEKLPYVIIIGVASIIVLGSIKLFTELTESLKTKLFSNLDLRISDYIISYRTPALTRYFTFVTNFGDWYGYVIVLIVCAIMFYLIFKNWKNVVQLTTVLLLSSVSNIILKQITHRARPDIKHLVTVESLSYPSGHTMTAMAFYGFLIYLLYTFKINKIIKAGVITLFVLLILSIGISRIYLGVHFPSDIVGGLIAGFIWVVFSVLILNILKVFQGDPNM
ncbi:phosphatase PAP2 family protein [Subsaxibacter sp. CAU 1640]|uniref:phosphatase PAP2 family protein n=1 Tax=Subsaxibacter sp. CAU 1640 TaxID=2933271 RepID=UPI00200404C1|nr:phosphatase PAP2 family protein [Subsaxibacter sp. CAU 1640]MCK7591348.1 phosphatase PAP2 family protein [Subsaxibacter sp. CAU 1640]